MTRIWRSACSAMVVAAGCGGHDEKSAAVFNGTSGKADSITSANAVKFSAAASYRLTSVQSLKAVEVHGFGLQNGANVDQWDYVGSASQQWHLTPQSDGSYAISNVNSGRCLDEKLDIGDNGLAMQQWACGTDSGQHWNLKVLSDGSYDIVNVHSGACLDLPDNNVTNGTTLQQWECGVGTNQHWKIDDVTAAAPSCQTFIACVDGDDTIGIGANQTLSITHGQWQPMGAASDCAPELRNTAIVNGKHYALSGGQPVTPIPMPLTSITDVVAGLITNADGSTASGTMSQGTNTITLNDDAPAGSHTYAVTFCGPSAPVTSVDPFDPASCTGTALTVGEAVARFAPGTTSVDLSSAMSVSSRARSCNATTGCGAWSATSAIPYDLENAGAVGLESTQVFETPPGNFTAASRLDVQPDGTVTLSYGFLFGAWGFSELLTPTGWDVAGGDGGFRGSYIGACNDPYCDNKALTSWNGFPPTIDQLGYNYTAFTITDHCFRIEGHVKSNDNVTDYDTVVLATF